MKSVVLLRNSEDTETNRALLAEHGYETLFRFSAALDDGTQDDGTQDEILYLSYGFILATTSINRLTEMLVSAHTSMAICFDLDNLRENSNFCKSCEDFTER